MRRGHFGKVKYYALSWRSARDIVSLFTIAGIASDVHPRAKLLSCVRINTRASNPAVLRTATMSETNAPSLEQIIDAICDVYSVSFQDIKGNSSAAPLLDARRTLAGLAYLYVNEPVGDIARVLHRQPTAIATRANQHCQFMKAHKKGYVTRAACIMRLLSITDGTPVVDRSKQSRRTTCEALEISTREARVKQSVAPHDDKLRRQSQHADVQYIKLLRQHHPELFKTAPSAHV